MAAACKEGLRALYQAGMAPYIVVSGRYSKGRSAFEGASCDRDCYVGPYDTEADFLTDVLMQTGVPRGAVLQEREATFTLENAEYIRKLLEEKQISVKRALICCQAFHARRCRMYFEYVFQDREIEFLMCPAVTQASAVITGLRAKRGWRRFWES